MTDFMTSWVSVWHVLKKAIQHSPPKPLHVRICLFCTSDRTQHLDKLDEGNDPLKNKPHHKKKTSQAKPTATKCSSSGCIHTAYQEKKIKRGGNVQMKVQEILKQSLSA